MRIFKDLAAWQNKPGQSLVLAIGNFDGLHAGHQKILSRVISGARDSKALPAVFTFREHPQQILHPSSRPKLLTGLEHRLFRLQQTGLGICFLLEFTREFSEQEPEAFVRDILVERLHVKKICLGYNARFGRKRRGDSSLMKALAEKHGFEFEEIPPVKIADGFVSSTRVRELVSGGDLKQAAECLGRPFSILAKVVRGDGRGKTIGYPTANLETADEVLPPAGVYTAKVRIVEIEKKAAGGSEDLKVSVEHPWLNAVLNRGTRPTFKSASGREVQEAFILDFQGDLYGKTLEVAFYEKIREEKAFPSTDELKKQIEKDVLEAGKRFLDH